MGRHLAFLEDETVAAAVKIARAPWSACSLAGGRPRSGARRSAQHGEPDAGRRRAARAPTGHLP
eukprot:14522335-Alexandrium_andersonii.AAC.1